MGWMYGVSTSGCKHPWVLARHNHSYTPPPPTPNPPRSFIYFTRGPALALLVVGLLALLDVVIFYFG